MTILLSTIIILTYMINGYAGLVLMVGILLWNIVIKNDYSVSNLLHYIVLCLPFSYIGITGTSMHQLYSWYNLLLVILVGTFIYKDNWKVNISRGAAIALVIVVFLLNLNLLWSNGLGKDIQEIIQILVMLIPLLLFHGERNQINLSKSSAEKLIVEYGEVCTATAISMLIQYILYITTHRVIGIIHFTGGGRTQCYVLFKGASILPIFMGVGLIMYFIHIMESSYDLKSLVNMVLIFAAMVLNSSRTGMLMALVVAGLICFVKILESPSIGKILVTVAGIAGAYYGVNYMTSKRASLDGFLDANGRTTTWINGLKIWTHDLKNFLIGEGFSGGMWNGITKTHNFAIQTVAQCGVIVGVIILGLFVVYFLRNKNNKYVYLPLFIVLSGMLVTDFYANAFTTIIFILVDIYGAKTNFDESIYFVGESI